MLTFFQNDLIIQSANGDTIRELERERERGGIFEKTTRVPISIIFPTVNNLILSADEFRNFWIKDKNSFGPSPPSRIINSR